MAVDPTSGMGRLTDLPRLKSTGIRSSETRDTAEQSGTSGKFLDPVNTDSGFAAHVRQSSAQFQETQGRITRARLGLAGLDEVQTILEKRLSPATGGFGIEAVREAFLEVEKVVTRVSFEGETLLDGFEGTLTDENQSPRELVLGGLRRVSDLRVSLAEDLRTSMVRLGELQVERANHMAASGAQSVNDPRDASSLLRQVLERMSEDREIVETGIRPENFVRFV